MPNKRWANPCLILVVMGSIILACTSESAPSSDDVEVKGAGSYLLGPDMPTVFSFDRGFMSCAVSWGTLGAPAPGPFTDPNMNLENVNFGMVVFSLDVSSFDVANQRVTMTGDARSITTVNDAIVENDVYKFTVEAVDGGTPSQDSFSMSLQGEGLMFDGHIFGVQGGVGLVSGDVVIAPR